MHQAPEVLFGEIAAYVESARALLLAGEWVDLKGLDAQVQSLCLAVAALTPEQAGEYGVELEYLREQLGVLEQEMRTQRDKVVTDIKGTDVVERANKAYAQGTSLLHNKPSG